MGFGDGGSENIYLTGENLGIPGLANDGLGLYSHQFDNTLFFKRLKAGASVTLSENDNSVIISLAAGSGPGEANDGQNLGTGSGIFAMKSGLNLQFKSLVAGNNVTLSSTGTDITINSVSDVINAANLGAGNQLFVSKTAGVLGFKTIVAGSNITLTGDSTTLTISAPNAGTGSINNASNLGSGAPVFTDKTDDILRFKSILAGSNITINSDANNITVNAAGDISSASNLGTVGAQVFSYKGANSLFFRRFVAGSNVTVTESSNYITLSTASDVLNGFNLGTGGTGLFSGKIAGILNFKSLQAGNNIVINTDDNYIYIEALGGGVINNAQNIGTGLGLFTSSVGDNLQFKTLLAGQNVNLSSSSNMITISALGDVNAAQNLGLNGGRVFANKTANTLQFRRIVAGTNVTVSEGVNDIVISSEQGTWGIINNARNLDSGAPVFAQVNGDNLEFRSLFAGTNVSIVQTPTSLQISVPNVGEINAGTNVGVSGAGVYKGKIGTNLQFKKFVSGTNINIVENANDIWVNTVNVVTDAFNLGTGEPLFQNKTGEILNFKTIKAGSSIQLDVTANDITINAVGSGSGSINDGLSLGTGTALFAGKSLDILQFKSIAAGTNVTFTEAGNTITIAAAGDVTNGLNLGSTGARVFATKIASQLQFRRLVAGSGVTIVEGTNDITISSTGGGGGGSGTITGAINLGSGSGIFGQINGTDLEFKSLIAGTNVTLSSTSTGITINASGGVGTITTAANLGTGNGIYTTTTGSTLNFKTLIAGTNTTITNDGTSITFNSVSDVTNGTSLGVTGARIFSAKSAGVLQFRRIIAGTNVTVTENTNDITISASVSGGGGGDMLKATYDANNDGIVDNSAQLNGQAASYYLNRTNHTGTQAAGTITGLAAVATSGLYSSLSGTPTIPSLINDLSDVTTSSPTSGQVLQWNGSQWINATVSGGGGGTTETRLLSFDGGNIVIRASGSSSDLSAVTATKDFSTASRSSVILNKPTTVVYHSVNVVFLASETVGRTELAIQSPDCNGATSLSQAIRPLAMKLNGGGGVAGTASTMSLLSGSTFTVLLTGYTGSQEQKASFIF
jgi:hypothetical protein